MIEFVSLIFIVSILVGVVNYKAFKFISRHLIDRRKIKRQDYGYIYFYRGKREDRFKVKIGRTNSWENRLKSARTSVSPYGIYILGATIVKDDVKAEQAIFKRFADERIRRDKKNEWFKLSLRLYLFIRAVSDPAVTAQAKEKLEWD